MTRILFIAYYFPPVANAGVYRSAKFVDLLPSEGYLPIVITGPAPLGNDSGSAPAGPAFPVPSDIPVFRAKGPVPGSSSTARRRLERWAAVQTSFSEWWTRAAMEAAASSTADVKLIFATMSPFESGEVAKRLSARLQIPWVADLRDPWALDEVQLYPTVLHRKLEKLKMQRVLSTASLIIMNTFEAAAALKSAFPRLRDKKIITITNGYDERDFAAPVVPRSDSMFRVVHAGGMLTDTGLRLRKRGMYRVLGGAVRGVDIFTRSPAFLLDALERWCQQRPEVTADLAVIFAGNTSHEDRLVAAQSTLYGGITFAGTLSHQKSLQLIRTADLLFLPMHNLPAGARATSVPGKTYEYMASGRPILAAVPDGDARDILSRCGTAWICRPDDVPGMVEVLDRVYTAWKSKASASHFNGAFVSQFERQNLTRALAAAFDAIGGQRPHHVQLRPSLKYSKDSEEMGGLF